MLNEKKKILKVKLKLNELQITENSDKETNNLNVLYFDLLNKTAENLVWQCISIFLQYIYLFSFLIEKNVSLTIIIYLMLV